MTVAVKKHTDVLKIHYLERDLITVYLLNLYITENEDRKIYYVISSIPSAHEIWFPTVLHAVHSFVHSNFKLDFYTFP